MTISITKSSRIVSLAVGAGLVLAVAFGSFAAPAQALTQAEATAIIQVLGLTGSQAAIIQGLVTTGGTGSTSCSFTGSLTIGATGAQVTCLQQELIAMGFSIPAGATGYFGTQTQAAVAAWQTSKGVTPPAGYFGPISQAAWGMGGTPGTPGTPSTPSGLSGGAGSIADADFISNLNNEDVGEDQNDVEVAGLEIEADDGSDIELTAVTLDFDRSSAGTGSSDDLEDYATEVTVWFDGDMVASVDADDFDDDNDFSRTISLDSGAIVRAGDTGDLVVAVSGIGNLDSDDADETWNVQFEGLRFRDAQGATITDSSTGDIDSTSDNDTTTDTYEREFTFATFATANDVELTVSEASDNPETQSIEAEDGDEVVLAVGTLEAEGSDIEIKELTATTTAAGTGSSDDIASQFILRIDGEEVDTINSTACVTAADCDGTGTTAVYVFDDVDYTVNEGDEVEFEIVAELNAISATFVAGDSLTADVDSAFIVAEDESGEDLSASELSGTLNGDAQTFYEDGISVVFASETASAPADADLDHTGSYTLRFDVTAFGADAYILDTTGTTTDVSGVEWSVSGGTFAPSGDEAGSTLTCSGCDDDTNTFIVRQGETEEFTLTVQLNNTGGTADFYGVQLDRVHFNDEDSAAIGDFTDVDSASGLPDDIETREIHLETA